MLTTLILVLDFQAIRNAFLRIVKKQPSYFRKDLTNSTTKFWTAKKQKLVEMLRNGTG